MIIFFILNTAKLVREVKKFYLIVYDLQWTYRIIFFILTTVVKDTYREACVSMKRVSTKGETFGRNKRDIL